MHSTAVLLQQEAYEYTCGIDTKTALEQLNASHYDLLIVDIKMLGNPVLEFIRTIPQVPEELPVIIVTSYPSLRSAIDYLELPISAYLLKPLVFDDLLAAALRAVNRLQPAEAVFTTGKRVADWSRDMENLVPKHKLPDTPRTTVDTTLALSMYNLVRHYRPLDSDSIPLPA